MNLPDVKILYNRLKASAKKRNIEFNLSVTDMYHLEYPLTCPILGIPMVFNRGKVQDNSYSIDRIDNTIGYQLDNIQIISYRANILKNNASAAELRMLSHHFN
jgi:hypothetical protein